MHLHRYKKILNILILLSLYAILILCANSECYNNVNLQISNNKNYMSKSSKENICEDIFLHSMPFVIKKDGVVIDGGVVNQNKDSEDTKEKDIILSPMYD